MTDETEDELRPQDHVELARGLSAEAAFLADHINTTDPQHTWTEQMGLLTDVIDQIHEHAMEAELQLEETDD